MHIESFRNYCLSKPGVTEEFPFGEQTLVFKVKDKMFALTDIEEFQRISLKCEPEVAIEYRERFPEVVPGYHLNKKHWNTVSTRGNLSEDLLRQMIDDSYALVAKGLPKAVRDELTGINKS